MLEVGRIVYKIAGRDSNKVAVIIDVIDDRFVLIDGGTRRKKVNVAHIEPTQKTVSVKKGAATSEVIAALEAAGFSFDKKGESRKAPARKKQAKAVKAKPATTATPAKAAASEKKADAKSAAPKSTAKSTKN